MKNTNMALAVITKYLDNRSPYLDFIKNAYENNLKPKLLIIVYSHGKNKKITEKLKNYLTNKNIELQLIKADSDNYLQQKLQQEGVTENAINTLTSSPLLDKYGLLPYGHYRNIAILAALTSHIPIDYLFFVDTDVYPWELHQKNNDYYFKNINFFGEHLKYLRSSDIAVTSSNYSGYYIIPPLKIKNLKKLLIGLQKEKAYQFLKNNNSTLIYANHDQKIRSTKKILGGNLGIDLDFIGLLPPFFSTTYIFEDRLYLGRGEDTLLGNGLWQKGLKVLDIDLKIFHDTYSDFPEPPDINSQAVKDRLYYAATGWLGRNPFLNWKLKEDGKLTESDFELKKENQYKNLCKGSGELAFYLNDKRFLKLPDIFQTAYGQLNKMIEDYQSTMRAWTEIRANFRKRRVS